MFPEGTLFCEQQFPERLVWFSRKMMWKQRSQEQGTWLRSTCSSQGLTPCYFCACDDCFCGRRCSSRSLLGEQQGPGAGVAQECGWAPVFWGRALIWVGEVAAGETMPSVPGGGLDAPLMKGGQMLWTVRSTTGAWNHGGFLMGDCSGRAPPAMAIPSPRDSVRVSFPHAQATSRE